MPKPKRKRKSNDTSLAGLMAAVDAAVAKQPAPFDARDSVRDRLFALVMQRIDSLQERRGDVLAAVNGLIAKPTDVRMVMAPLQKSLSTMLQRAGAGHSVVHVAAFGIAYAAIIAAWRNDTSADLSRTMKVCDKALSVLENIAG